MNLLQPILVGLLVGIAILFIVDFDNKSLEEIASEKVSIIQAAENSNDPLIIKEAENARVELQKIQTERAEAEKEQAYREQNPEVYAKQQAEKEKQFWRPIYSIGGVVIIGGFFLLLAQIIINKRNGKSTFS